MARATGSLSSTCGQKARNISKVVRPSSAVCGVSSQEVTISPKSASAVYGTCQPPAVNPPEGSSSAAPGACITPSRVRKVFTVRIIIGPLEAGWWRSSLRRQGGRGQGGDGTFFAGS